jgi:hypothetical protein
MNDKEKNDCEAARKAGCIFYEMPWKIDPKQIDPLILPVVTRINESGFVWTGESCQGHPDSKECGAWASNTRPMLRLITWDENVGRLCSDLISAYQLLHDETMRSLMTDSPKTWEVGAIEIYPQPLHGGWTELLIYLWTATAYQRDQGIEVLKKFSELICRPEY